MFVLVFLYCVALGSRGLAIDEHLSGIPAKYRKTLSKPPVRRRSAFFKNCSHGKERKN
jgi:hypothetical protein